MIFTHNSQGLEVPSHFCYVDGSMQDCNNSIANALELLQSCTDPSMWSRMTLSTELWSQWALYIIGALQDNQDNSQLLIKQVQRFD